MVVDEFLNMHLANIINHILQHKALVLDSAVRKQLAPPTPWKVLDSGRCTLDVWIQNQQLMIETIGGVLRTYTQHCHIR